MVRLLQLTRGQRQPHLRLPSPIQQPTRMSKPRNHPFPQNILQSEPVWLEYIIVLGRVCTEFFEKTLNQVDPFQYILGYQPPLFPRSGEPTKRFTVYEWLERNKPQSPCTSLTCPEIQPGQWVWLSTRDLHLHLHLPCHKVPGMWVPFKIIRQLTPVSYHLQLPANYCISPTFHVSLLKPAGGPRGRMKKVTQWTPHPSLWMARRSITSSAPVVPPSQQQRS